MNCLQSKKRIGLTYFLKTQGYELKRISGNNFWYIAKYRNERHASLKVNIVQNTFTDFGGDGKSGNLIDLAILVWGCTVKEALARLSSLDLATPVSFSFPKQNTFSAFTISKIQLIQNRALLDYLAIRSIPLNVAQDFCQEIYYSVNGKSYFTIGIENDSKGWEHRNKYFKGCLGTKDITFIPGNSCLSVFEGLFDFLSGLVLWPELKANSILILNSVSQLSKAVEKIRRISAEKIECYLDGDNAGQKTFAQLREHFPAEDKSGLYTTAKCKDLNEYLCKRIENGINNAF